MADTYWFRHDVGAMNDRLMQRLIRKHGMEGVGIYWGIVEVLYQEDGILRLEDMEDLAFSFHVEVDLIQAIVSESGLFIIEGEEFYSERILNELNTKKELSAKAKKSAKARWVTEGEQPNRAEKANAEEPQCERKATALPTHDDSNANAMRPDSEGNANTEQYSTEEYNTPLDTKVSIPPKGKKHPRFVKPSLEQVSAYCKERGNDVDPQKFLDFYESKGWKVGKNAMKDWKASVRTWEKSEIPYGRASPGKTFRPEGYAFDSGGYDEL